MPASCFRVRGKSPRPIPNRGMPANIRRRYAPLSAGQRQEAHGPPLCLPSRQMRFLVLPVTGPEPA